MENRIFPILPYELLYAVSAWVLLDAISFGPFSSAVDTLERVFLRIGE